MIKKSVPVYHKIAAKNIDKFKGIIKDVVIINSGEDKVGDNIDETFLSQVAEHGNAQSQGVKSRFGHPNLCDDALGTYIGRYKNFRVSETEFGESVIADLHLDDISKKSPKGNLHNYVIEMASKANDMFGNSIVFQEDKPEKMSVPVEGEDGEEDTEVEKMFIRLKSLVASDLVDSPAATSSLFKDAEDFASKATDWLDNNPEVVKRLQEKPEVLAKFLTKYFSNKSPMTTKKTKSVSEEIREGFKSMTDNIKEMLKSKSDKPGNKKKSLDVDLENGETAVVETDSTEPAIGDAVMISGEAATDGDHVTADGRTISTEGGIITAIEPAEELSDDSGDEGEKDDDEAEATEKKDSKKPAVKSKEQKEIDRLKKENADLKKDMEEFKAEMETMQAVLKGKKSGGKPEKRSADFNSNDKSDKSGRFTKDDLLNSRRKFRSVDDKIKAYQKQAEEVK